MSNLELRLIYNPVSGLWVAQWLQDDVVLFEASSVSSEHALAGLVHEVGKELADVTGSIEKDDEE